MDLLKRLEIYDQLVSKCDRFTRKGKTVPYTSSNGYMFSLFNKDGELVLETKFGIPLIKGDIKYKVEFSHTDGLDNYLNKDFVFPALSVIDEGIQDDSPAYRNDLITSAVTDEIVHNLRGGELQVRFELRDKIIPDVINRLDIYTDTVVKEMNAVYADATPESGFQSVASNNQLKNTDAISVNGKFKIALFNPNNGSSIKDSAGNLQTIEVDLSGISILQNLIDKINGASSSDGHKVTATLDSAGHLELKSNETNINFAIINESSEFDANNVGINQFFGFNNIFTHEDKKFYDEKSSANSAISLKVLDNISLHPSSSMTIYLKNKQKKRLSNTRWKNIVNGCRSMFVMTGIA